VAMRIIANGADKADFMSEITGVQGEVERRSAQVFGARENIPQHFTETYNFQFSRFAPKILPFTIPRFVFFCFASIIRHASEMCTQILIVNTGQFNSDPATDSNIWRIEGEDSTKNLTTDEHG
jgi:hypothetical protein